MTDDLPRQSRESFEAGYYCAESVLLAIGAGQGIESDIIPRIATGFCSGVANTRGMCGALSGGIMGLGLIRGRSTPAKSVDPVYEAVGQLLERFQDRFGTINCFELCGCDLATPEGQQQFTATNQGERCGLYVQEATRLVLEIGGKPDTA